MKLNKLASVILRGTFLIDTRAAESLYPLAEQFLKGEKVAFFDDPAKKAYLDTYVYTLEGARQNIQAQDQSNTDQNPYADAPAGSIASIPLQGVIAPDDYCGSIGTSTISSWLMAALVSPNIIGAVLIANSPGGAIQGTNECADVIATVSSLMPVEVFCNGQLCSAAVWLACNCRITASSGTVEIGCIGTAGTYKDYSKGSTVISHYVTADASFDKNKEAIEVFKGNYAVVRGALINPTNDIFLNAVKSGRGDALQLTDVKDDAGNVIGQYPLTGQVYLAQAAIDLGLIDAIGDLNSVLTSIRDRASSNSSNQINNMSLFGTKFKKLNALSGKKAADISEAEIVAVNEEIKAELGEDCLVVISATQLEEANGYADAVAASLTSLNAALALTGAKAHKNIAEAITALVADRDAEHARAEEYGDQPAVAPAKPKAKGESEGNLPDDKKKTGAKKYETSYDRELATRNATLKEAGLD